MNIRTVFQNMEDLTSYLRDFGFLELTINGNDTAGVVLCEHGELAPFRTLPNGKIAAQIKRCQIQLEEV